MPRVFYSAGRDDNFAYAIWEVSYQERGIMINKRRVFRKIVGPNLVYPTAIRHYKAN